MPTVGACLTRSRKGGIIIFYIVIHGNYNPNIPMSICRSEKVVRGMSFIKAYIFFQQGDSYRWLH